MFMGSRVDVLACAFR